MAREGTTWSAIAVLLVATSVHAADHGPLVDLMMLAGGGSSARAGIRREVATAGAAHSRPNTALSPEQKALVTNALGAWISAPPVPARAQP